MLRIQPYQEYRHGASVKQAFTEIFDKSELPYFNGFQSSGLSYVCTARTGVVQAFILVKTTPDDIADYEIAFLGVLPRYRNKGYAKRMIEHVKNASSGKSLWLNVLDSNKEAVALYNKLGFDVYENFISGGQNATRFTYGLEHQCYSCQRFIKPAETSWQDTPTSVIMTQYGLKQVETIQPKCRQCHVRIES